MNRLEAIGAIIDNLTGNELVVHANGAISRESFYCCDRGRNFYLLGSMGLASSVGLGLAISRPQSRVIVLDGDGNVLMGFGNLAMIGAMKPPNLVHVVLNNGVYGTTGNQPTIAPRVPLDKAADACGYRSVRLITTREELSDALREIPRVPGPQFIHVRVSAEVQKDCPRIPYSARAIKVRFKDAIG